MPYIGYIAKPYVSLLAYFNLLLMKILKMRQLRRQSSNVLCLGFIFFAYLSINSCVIPKRIVYFNNLKKDTLHPGEIVVTGVTPFVDPKIETNDILSITIQTLAQNEGNAPVAANSSASPNLLSGFLVDKDGNIEISLIGYVKVAGLTTREAKELIEEKAAEIYNKPVVNVRIANFEVMVVGDIARPGPVIISNEKATIVDVLALAGDLNMTARRKNILLARREGDSVKFVRFDMTTTDIFHSPYLYVKQHDYIYVEQNNFKKQTSDNTFTRIVSYASGIVGIVSLLFILKIIK